VFDLLWNLNFLSAVGKSNSNKSSFNKLLVKTSDNLSSIVSGVLWQGCGAQGSRRGASRVQTSNDAFRQTTLGRNVSHAARAIRVLLDGRARKIAGTFEKLFLFGWKMFAEVSLPTKVCVLIIIEIDDRLCCSWR